MKAVAVTPGTPNSVHLEEIDKPTLDAVPDGLGVLVRVLKVGVDATDREINDALYGNAPDGDGHLVIGHESFGVVEAVGENVRRVKVGDYVTATVRRPGGSIYDLIGTNDMTSEEEYYERGINLRHGYLTEYFVDEEEYIVRVPLGSEASARSDGADELCRQGGSSGLRGTAADEGLEASGRIRIGSRPDWSADHPGVETAGSRSLYTRLVARLLI